MQGSRLPLFPLLFVHLTPVFPEIFVALDVELHQVTDFNWIDFSGPTVADLRKQHSVRGKSAPVNGSKTSLQPPDYNIFRKHLFDINN